nr:uncharacterized protein LOC111982966 [Quercus suber]
MANSSRRNNGIESLMVDGRLSSDQGMIADCLLEVLVFPMIFSDNAEWLDRSFEDAEIFDVIQNFNGDKSLGLDGQFEKSLNATFITLIPKKVQLLKLRIFTSLVFRLKTSLPGLLCKLDVEKAFDHVNWGFLMQLLEWGGFSAKWRRWIFLCISTVRFFILINGFMWLRQGDPLYPLLFVLVMEALGRMLNKAIHEGHMLGFGVGNLEGRSLAVSHLLFVDDSNFL